MGATKKSVRFIGETYSAKASFEPQQTLPSISSSLSKESTVKSKSPTTPSLPNLITPKIQTDEVIDIKNFYLPFCICYARHALPHKFANFLKKSPELTLAYEQITCAFFNVSNQVDKTLLRQFVEAGYKAFYQSPQNSESLVQLIRNNRSIASLSIFNNERVKIAKEILDRFFRKESALHPLTHLKNSSGLNNHGFFANRERNYHTIFSFCELTQENLKAFTAWHIDRIANDLQYQVFIKEFDAIFQSDNGLKHEFLTAGKSAFSSEGNHDWLELLLKDHSDLSKLISYTPLVRKLHQSLYTYILRINTKEADKSFEANQENIQAIKP